MIRVTFFTKPDCTLCQAAWFVIERVRGAIRFETEVVDISAPGQEQWFDAYRNDIPVVHVNGKDVFRHHVDERTLRELLGRLDD
ncbi:MAG: glutaredoxin family protein [Planctomycetota bacterium]